METFEKQWENTLLKALKAFKMACMANDLDENEMRGTLADIVDESEFQHSYKKLRKLKK